MNNERPFHRTSPLRKLITIYWGGNGGWSLASARTPYRFETTAVNTGRDPVTLRVHGVLAMDGLPIMNGPGSGRRKYQQLLLTKLQQQLAHQTGMQVDAIPGSLVEGLGPLT